MDKLTERVVLIARYLSGGEMISAARKLKIEGFTKLFADKGFKAALFSLADLKISDERLKTIFEESPKEVNMPFYGEHYTFTEKNRLELKNKQDEVRRNVRIALEETKRLDKPLTTYVLLKALLNEGHSGKAWEILHNGMPKIIIDENLDRELVETFLSRKYWPIIRGNKIVYGGLNKKSSLQIPPEIILVVEQELDKWRNENKHYFT